MSEAKINILLVDDHPENLLALEAVLASTRYNLVRAYSGEEALKAVLMQDFALILLDVQMPGLNGFETAKLIRQRKRSQNVPIVFITAVNHQNEYVIQGYELGATDYILKPFDPDTLKLKVQGYLKTFQDREILEKLVQERTSELVLTNERLKKSHNKISNILASIKDAFFTINTQWRFTYVNEEFVKLFNLKGRELLNQTVWGELPQLISTDLHKVLQKAMHEQQLVRYETPFQYLNIWLELSAYPSDEGLSVHLRDITKRKQMEATIRLNHQRLEALVKLNNNMTDATTEELGEFALEEIVKLTGSQFGYLAFVNEDETKVDIFAFSKNALRENRVIDKPLELSVAQGGLWAEAIRQRKATIINNYCAANDSKKGLPFGHIVLKRILNVPIFDGKRMVMLVALANKTEDYNQSDIKQAILLIKSFWTIIQRKIANEKLRESEEKFRYLFENSMDGIFLIKTDGTYISANPSACKMLGMSEQEICQRGRNEIVDLSDPRTRELISARKRTGRCRGEVYYIHKNGSRIPMEVTSQIFQSSNGEEFFGIFIRDISERIKTQQEMTRLDRLHLIGQMAAGIGHEVRNPMTIVRGFLQMLSGKPRYNEDREFFDLMISELDRANAIITEFLSLARNTPAKLQPHNLCQIIEDLFPLLQTDALNNDKNVEKQLQPIPDINIDKNEICQLILNLVRNGFDAMQRGGCVTIKTNIDREDVVLSIEDEGNGIAPEVLDKLGTPFLTTKDKGTGLGLATCFGIAKRNNAQIDVDTSSEGTIFSVRFKITT